MTKETTIMPKGIEQLATGKKKDGSKWTMYKITDQNDTEYKSFEAMNLNTPYHISYEEEPKKPFTNKEGKYIEPKGVERFIKRAVITDAPPMPSNPQSGTGQQVNAENAVEARFRAVEARLKALEGRIIVEDVPF